ncbi:MAG: RNA polymerase sigma factor [Pirellulaceae bacterium]
MSSTQTQGDLQLVRDAQRGDREAFGQLVSKYQDRLYSALTYLVGCPIEAEDLTQDAFLRALNKLDPFRLESSFYTWLYRIARNLMISKKRRRTPLFCARVEDQPGLPHDEGETPLQRHQREGRAQQTRDALTQLDEDHRTVLLLRELEGFDYQAIADILNIPPGTVRSRLHRARNQMRRRLEHTMSDEP